MNSTFGSRRKARRLGQEEEEDDGGVDTETTMDSTPSRRSPVPEQVESTTEVKQQRPLFTPRGTHHKSSARKSSSLRLSFGGSGGGGAGEGPSNEDDATSEGGNVSEVVFTPKKSRLSRQASERNALRKSILSATAQGGRLPIRAGAGAGAGGRLQGDDRPSYSKEHLDELRNSTPSTPKELRTPATGGGSAGGERDADLLGVLAKFGSAAAAQADNHGSSSHIPSATEIREKKSRRARLALAQEVYMALDDADDESHSDSDTQLTTLRPKWTGGDEKETRLVREDEDEDMAEGYDEFVEDTGRIALGKEAEREQARRKRAEMREMIAAAEGEQSDDDDDDDGGSAGSGSDASDEAERIAAYEAAQTRAGAYHSRPSAAAAGDEGGGRTRPRTPPRITPLPSLSACIERLRSTLAKKEESRARKANELQAIARERAEIAVREVEIQRLLREADEKYRVLREEAERGATGGGGGGGGEGKSLNGLNNVTPVGTPISGRGLESFGEGRMLVDDEDGDGGGDG
ncbi:MAG: hypothetical protein M1816_001378 [Peltula sp. TS41687]|nr:MAG: hypothetical protein M1816_001378 [Peltula sp. TS41687]